MNGIITALVCSVVLCGLLVGACNAQTRLAGSYIAEAKLARSHSTQAEAYITQAGVYNAQDRDGEKNEAIDIQAKDVVYDLPFPGILPDHPLYILKVARDKTKLFFTRDSIKKINLLLLYSDKKINMAQPLSDRGRWDRSSRIAFEAEEDFGKMIDVMNVSKKQGASATADFIKKAKVSNQKHKHIIESLIGKMPQGERVNIENALKLNNKMKGKLNKM